MVHHGGWHWVLLGLRQAGVSCAYVLVGLGPTMVLGVLLLHPVVGELLVLGFGV